MALCLLSQMPAAGVVPNVISFSAGISACEKGGEWQVALYLLSQMPAAGVVPNEISFSAGISACEKGGEWQMALLLLSQMPLARAVPNEISFSAGISACEKRGEWQMALCLLSQMPSAGVVPNQISFNAGISACEKGGGWQMAVFLLSQMPAARVVPDEMPLARAVPDEISLSAASYGQAIDAAWPEAVVFELFDEAMQSQTWPDTLQRGGAWLDLHDHSCGSAMLAVSWWLAEVVPKQLTRFRSADCWIVDFCSSIFEVVNTMISRDYQVEQDSFEGSKVTLFRHAKCSEAADATRDVYADTSKSRMRYFTGAGYTEIAFLCLDLGCNAWHIALPAVEIESDTDPSDSNDSSD
ncbi:unnamed protein product [Symbiodinium sp. KB8]|nr:unnamed protein product [Symbiodinium sp. KB8]